MNRKPSSLWLFFAGFAFLTSVVLSLVFLTESGPNSSWIQAGAAVSLILVTWRYVSLTNAILMESEKARLQSLSPLIVLRSRQYISDQGTPLTETYLLNAGMGTAVQMEYSTSIVFPMNPDIESEKRSNHPEVSSCFQGKDLKQDDALNPSYGGIESRNTIVIQNMIMQGTSALAHSGFGAIVLYEDILGRGFCTLYLQRGHTFFSIYPSSESEKSKNQIRKALLDPIGTADAYRIMRENGQDYWKVIVKDFEERKELRRSKRAQQAK